MLERAHCGRWTAMALAAALLGPAAAHARTVSLWHMDEKSGTTMVDAARDNDGRLAHVRLGAPGFAGSAYRFNGSTSIVTVRNSGDLNPHDESFLVTVHVKTWRAPPGDSADLIRKGEDRSARTYWKLELRHPTRKRRRTVARCFFRGSSKTKAVSAPNRIANGRWHTITCMKHDDSIGIVVDGTTMTKKVSVGSISNAGPLTIGGKDGLEDGLRGLLDEVRVVT